ncbi:hypothetical protein CYMTET_38615 [Cymbomonas tetramitiformis]|uniref:Fe2OG dioxygenase domain-containing protein n=1 Tax=Cymbomonas tetramitiformis TaxID=36881 RepID=A0AAE0CDV7_9CHLO|nr:hypothetical protein CYMTET_38615 [Cymbomonas tetramitiformis]
MSSPRALNTLTKFSERERVYLTADSWYIHRPGALKVSPTVFDQLWEKRALFEQQFFRIFGKRVPIPRRQGLFAATSLTCRFSGMATQSLPLAEHPFLEELMATHGKAHNAVFVNWYENNKQHIGAHADDERDIVQDVGILSVTLGHARIFRVRARKTRSVVMDVTLADGDVFFMGGEFQKEFLHEVPKRAFTVGDGRRIDFTLRRMRGASDASRDGDTLSRSGGDSPKATENAAIAEGAKRKRECVDSEDDDLSEHGDRGRPTGIREWVDASGDAP